MKLRRSIEEVAALRRKLPVGGAVPQDYAFDQGSHDIDSNSSAERQTRFYHLHPAQTGPGNRTAELPRIAAGH